MLEIYKPTKNGAQPLKKAGRGTWINAINPTPAEVKQLRTYIDFPDEVLTSVKDLEEIPIIEPYKNFQFLLIRVPKELPGDELHYHTLPIGLLYNKHYFITISTNDTDTIERFKKYHTNHGTNAVLDFFYATTKSYLSCLKNISKKIYDTQEDIEHNARNEDIIQLLEFQKSLVYFGTALKSNYLITERFTKHKTSAKHKDYVDDIMIEHKQAMNMSKVYSIIVSELINSVSSIISNNLNKIIKTLTVITIILMLPTLVASIYGMNVTLPFQHHPHAFAITVLISVILSIIGAIGFWASRLF